MKPWATLTPKLDILDKKGKPPSIDDILQVDDRADDAKNSISRKIVAALPLSSRVHRDLAIDYMNPREELAKYVQTIDTIPAFDKPPLTMLTPEDDLAVQQIGIIKAGIQNWAAEDSKYNPDTPAQPKTSSYAPAERSDEEWNKIIKQNLLLQHQNALDQTSSL